MSEHLLGVGNWGTEPVGCGFPAVGMVVVQTLAGRRAHFVGGGNIFRSP